MSRLVEVNRGAAFSSEDLDLGQPSLFPEIELIRFFVPEDQPLNILRKLNKAGRAVLSLGVAVAVALVANAIIKENKKDFVVAGVLTSIGLAALNYDAGGLAISHIEAAIEK